MWCEKELGYVRVGFYVDGCYSQVLLLEILKNESLSVIKKSRFQKLFTRIAIAFPQQQRESGGQGFLGNVLFYIPEFRKIQRSAREANVKSKQQHGHDWQGSGRACPPNPSNVSSSNSLQTWKQGGRKIAKAGLCCWVRKS